MRALLCAAAAALTLSTLAAAQAPAPPVSPSDEHITVTAPAPGLQEQLHAFVRGLITAPHQAQVARWDHRICPGVFGLTNRNQAQFIVDRIARRAHDLRLETARPRCRANIAIFVTPDAQTFTHEFTRQFPIALFSGNTDDYGQFEHFETDERPVRWWHVSLTYSDSGIIVRPGAWINAGGVAHDGMLSSGVHENLDHAIIVVDARRAEGVRLDALADYLAMVSLANLNPETDTRQFPTVLNLFAEPTIDNPRPEGMSAWDVAYLIGLYRMQRNAVNSRRQRAEVTSRMAGFLTHN